MALKFFVCGNAAGNAFAHVALVDKYSGTIASKQGARRS